MQSNSAVKFLPIFSDEKKVEVSLHFTFVVWFICSVVNAFGSWSFSPLIAPLMVMPIVLCHEFGHIFGGRMVGLRGNHVLMTPIGGMASIEVNSIHGTSFGRLWTTIAGPLVNVVFAAAGFGLMYLLGVPLSSSYGLKSHPEVWMSLLNTFTLVNVLLLVFNALPAYPMDGGRVVRYTLEILFGQTKKAFIRAEKIAFWMAMTIFVLGGIWAIWRHVWSFAIIAAVMIWINIQERKNGRPAYYGYAKGSKPSVEALMQTKALLMRDGTENEFLAATKRGRKPHPYC